MKRKNIRSSLNFFMNFVLPFSRTDRHLTTGIYIYSIYQQQGLIRIDFVSLHTHTHSAKPSLKLFYTNGSFVSLHPPLFPFFQETQQLGNFIYLLLFFSSLNCLF